MECDRYEILRQIVRIARNSGFDYTQGIKDILRLLSELFHLKECSFYLLDDRRKTFRLCLTGSGEEILLPASRKIENSPEYETARHNRRILKNSCFYLPVSSRRRCFGVLSVGFPDNRNSAPILDLFEAACDELARLVQYGRFITENRRRMAQLALLSGLGQKLNQSRTLRELLRSAVGSILQYGNFGCVILRPLLGETVLGRSYVRTQSEFRRFRPLFFDLEGEMSVKAVSERKPVARWKIADSEDLPPDFPPDMVSIPLLFQERALGSLTLFGSPEPNPFTLAPEGRDLKFFTALGSQIAHALERLAGRERLESLSAENDRKLRETSLLYRSSRLIHSTLRLNELMHLILSAAVVPNGGGFERAMLFMINERSGTLQGMLGVTRKSASLVLPVGSETAPVWERPQVDETIQDKQRRVAFNRKVVKQRLPLDEQTNALARAARKARVILVPDPNAEPKEGAALARALELGPYACAPLSGRDRVLGVLVVDNPGEKEEITPDRLRFLELFANQAGSAMENSMLLHRLETAHEDLRETQERLIQGEKMAVLGEMAASIVHELRNPLVPIGGFAKRLSRLTPSGSRENEYSSTIVREVRRMEEMLTDILSFSKKQDLLFTECRLDQIIEEALDLEADLLDWSSIRINIEVEKNLPGISGDRQKLRQVILNLLTNARQSMLDGGNLAVRAYATTLRGDEAAAVEVEDTGGGIPPDVIRNIFNPFFTTKDKGTGLGLSISQRIIENHGGEIEVKNLERGTLFVIRLPVQPAASRPAVKH